MRYRGIIGGFEGPQVCYKRFKVVSGGSRMRFGQIKKIISEFEGYIGVSGVFRGSQVRGGFR